MRKHDVRKWLHAILDLLPVILIPVFMIYSHRHTIDSGSIQVAQNEVVEFNQLGKEFNSTNWSPLQEGNLSVSFSDNNVIIVDVNYSGVGGDPIGLLQNFYGYGNVLGHKYISRVRYDLIVGSSITLPYLEFAGVDVNYSLVSGNLYENYFTASNLQDGYSILKVGGTKSVDDSWSFSNFQIFDLTVMFGVGNEPTLEQFNSWFDYDYFVFTYPKKQLLKDVSTITYNDTDIMSQFTYQLYNSVDKYFNMGNVFHLGEVYDWFNLNIFNGNAPISIYIVYQIVLYELIMDLLMLLYSLFMWFIDMIEKLMEKPLNSIK